MNAAANTTKNQPNQRGSIGSASGLVLSMGRWPVTMARPMNRWINGNNENNPVTPAST